MVWVKDPVLPMNCSVGCRWTLDPALLWCRAAAAAAARNQLLAWEFPYAVGAALKRKKKQKTKNRTNLRAKVRMH